MATSFIDRDSSVNALVAEGHFLREDSQGNLQAYSRKIAKGYMGEALVQLKITRLVGAKLDDAFVSMAPHVVDETQVQPTFLTVEGRQLEGIRYQGDTIYRKVEEFGLCHRLQAYCLAQTLSQQQLTYVITRSDRRFAVWVSISDLPERQASMRP